MKTEIIDKKIRDLPRLIDNSLNSKIIPSVEMAKEIERCVKSILNQLKQENLNGGACPHSYPGQCAECD